MMHALNIGGLVELMVIYTHLWSVVSVTACGCRQCASLIDAASMQQVRNEKARRFLSNMKQKPGTPFDQYFPNVDPLALALMRRLLAFDPSDRPSAEEALADPYFQGAVLLEVQGRRCM